MSSIKEIRELTGLSQTKIAAWLGVSKSLVQFAEKGDRSLPSEASQKLSAMIVLAQQIKDANQANRSVEKKFTDPEKLASRHKRKMEFHQRSAMALQIQLRRLATLHPQINSRLALLDAMKNNNIEWYSATAQDKTWIEMIEWFSKERMSTTGPPEQELLQDKIEVHLAYAEIHKQRWEKFLELTTS